MFDIKEFEKYLKRVGIHDIEEVYVGNNQDHIRFMYGYDRCTFLINDSNGEGYVAVLRARNSDENKREMIEEVSALIALYLEEAPMCFYKEHATVFTGIEEDGSEIRNARTYSVIEWNTHNKDKRQERLTEINNKIVSGNGISNLYFYNKEKKKAKNKKIPYCGKL